MWSISAKISDDGYRSKTAASNPELSLNSRDFQLSRRLHSGWWRLLLSVLTVFFFRAQTIVSVNKRRFIDAELSLDLDLTYIADRYPSYTAHKQ
eukprot:2803475-Rhodomonas_salina.1